ncbi:ion transporter [Woodsholea maritima]|uniref:ion transporter n=1 Tax=Woodsholea maritima TaxID=240237 RepID=UPI0003713F53|nr:ion transporter [Woodsholea maritima]
MTSQDATSPSLLKSVVENAYFTNAITGVILLNAAILGAQTYALPHSVRETLHVIDTLIVWIFVFELALKLLAYRQNFFKSGWNIFDLFVVSLSFIPDAGAFTVLRALRALRLFRLFSVMPEMRRVVESLGHAIPGMGAIFMVLGLIFYVASVMGAKLFGASHPEWFGDLGASAYTLFQVMTLESWSMGIARPVMDIYPYAWAFFVPFVILTTFAVLNLFIAVMVDSLQSQHAEEADSAQSVAHDEREVLRQELMSLREEIRALRDDIKAGRD